jgi:hypothetical protein
VAGLSIGRKLLSGMLCVGLIQVVGTPSFAQESSAFRTKPVARAIVLETAPVIDGDVLNDPAWEGAEPITGFFQVRPNEGQPASQRTEVFVGFTETTMHVGVVAYDDEPTEVLGTDMRRDSSLDDTDAFLFIVDGLLDRQNGYVFGTSPAGVQFDGQVTKEESGRFTSGGGGFNLNWDAPWKVQTLADSFGWSAEFEIPLSTLRFGQDEEQTWGFNFQRNIRRNYEVVYWAPLDRQRNLYRVSEAGSIEGIRVPKQRNLQITPYVLASTQDGGDLVERNNEEEFGVDLKYSITPSLTLDATYNTDFAQVEADDQQINLDRFSLFFPEKRPFFLENAGQFTVGNPREVELFFSRRIGISDSGEQLPIDGGLRLSGKVGSTTNVGLLYMASDAVDGIAPGNDFTVARINQELFVDRKGDGSFLTPKDLDNNRTYSIDGRWGIGDDLMLSGWFARTETPGLTGDDDAFALKASYSSPTWDFNAEHTEVGGDFNPEVGFLARTEFEKNMVFVMYKYRPDNLWGLLELRPHVRYQEYRDAVTGLKESASWHIDNHWEFTNGYLFETGGNLIYERVESPFEIVPGVIIPTGVYDHGNIQLVVRTNQAAPLSFYIRTNYGGAWGGDRYHAAPTLRYRIGDTFSSELSVNYNDFDLPYPNGDFNVALTRLRLSYSFTPNVLLQALLQYNERSDTYSTNLRFSWLRSANTGLFLVYNEIDERGIGAPPRGKEFIIKFSHIFDVFN